MADTDKTNPVQSAERIFTILEALAEQGPTRLIDLSERLGLHKSTVHRLLASLISMGYAEQNERTGEYFPTFKIVGLSAGILKNTDVLTVVRPRIAALAEVCDETVHFVQRQGTDVIYLEKLESQSVKARAFRLSSRVGLTSPMYCSAVGKAILSELPDFEAEAVWKASEITARTEYTITDLDKLKDELEATRRRGYAIDDQENEIGIRCIAVPVLDHNGSPRYALSISSVAGRMTDAHMEELAIQLKKTAADIRTTLGYLPPKNQ